MAVSLLFEISSSLRVVTAIEHHLGDLFSGCPNFDIRVSRNHTIDGIDALLAGKLRSKYKDMTDDRTS
jgi:hypothetical protein